ncbi:MAG: 50S ribosomal protein L13 [Candidatus Schekmanbacteria bacterium RBG_13_48_7]|uniref:Large ribosomal subunit protein uL13 n=1 Tax=Candidatus Schekmanbacteria bacterium RBG_13_48_7 TaxID=1817878 RepID=A0A1F7RSP8_9BACT|nr:MAG: 50S ribosomal protein L13 [Candidatus Schekmanbacteria bacterium RBG_13_48_7]
MKTYATKKTDVQRKWFLIDASAQKLGRLASTVAILLRGKHKPSYVPYLDVGDHVIVTNVEKLDLSEKKLNMKTYAWHSGYPGGLKQVTARKLLGTYPERIFLHAVKGMLPKNRLGRAMIKKLRIVTGTEHPYKAQKPQEYQLIRENTE